MSELSELADALLGKTKHGIDVWRVRKGIYRCPECASYSVAREENRTTRYGADGKHPESSDVERIIRCMDCGTTGSE